MADPLNLTDTQFLETDPDVLGLQRQRQIANLLTGQAFNAPQGQMISGRYVKPSALQQALPMINAAIGGLTNANLDTKQQELAAALRGKQMEVAQQYAQAKTPQERMAAAMSPYAPKAIQTAYAERLKGIKAGEGEKIFFEDGGTIEGAPKYHPLQTIDMGTKGILVIDPNTGKREIVQKGIDHAGQVVETANGPMLVNTRTGQATPIMGAGGQPLAPKLTTEQTKDITSINQQNATIDGALKAVKASPDAFSFKRGLAQDLPGGETLAGRVDTPEQAAARAYVYNNVSAVIKERAGTAQSAGELQRLNSFMPGPKDNAQQIENKLNGFKTYLKDLETGTRQNPNVPTQQQPTQPSAPTQRAFMGSEPIVVKNGKWVYEKTGKAVE